MIVIIIFVVIVFMLVWIKMRQPLKSRNVNYNIVDDLLYFTGIPSVILYMVTMCARSILYPEIVGNRLVREVFFTPLLWILLGWMIISIIIFQIRNKQK